MGRSEKKRLKWMITGIVIVAFLLIGGVFGGIFVIFNWDSDGDGVIDRNDDFKNDKNEWKDNDNDGYGDNLADSFPNDPAASKDSDLDGYPDFLNDGMTLNDSTTGIERLDAFPLDPAASLDSDGDSSPDEWNEGMTANDSIYGLEIDAFPENTNEWKDEDNDGFGDNIADSFPEDPAASKDRDKDGYPDKWNPGENQSNSTTGLELDLFPDDNKHHGIEDLRLKFISVSNGSFFMGSPKGVGDDDEHPLHRVNITKGFQMMKCEVTRDQWEAVMGETNSILDFEGDNLPIVMVSWQRCKVYMDKLTKLDPGHTYRFPTEAEWEYCCRAGSDTKFYWGNGSVFLDEHAWYWDNSGKEPHPVGQKKPNPWGFHDMYGNAIEWCNDFYGEKYYQRSPENDPPGPNNTVAKVLRGGSFQNEKNLCNSAVRDGWYPDSTYQYGMGFRMVRTENEKN
ncbi:MAG: SUMF1/EgtB/PvdO family nonheme iron enzyme [Thermoplasmatota archaeon]